MELITITLLYYLGFISISTITIIYFSYKTSIRRKQYNSK